jgi:hypothetical protein
MGNSGKEKFEEVGEIKESQTGTSEEGQKAKSSLDRGARTKSLEVELARFHLERIATGRRLTNLDKHLKSFALQLHEIVGHWQRRAGTKNPLDYAVEFAPGISATLIQVFALMPEEYQEYINVNDPKRSPNNEPYSWLDESIMNVLVQLECEKRNPDDTVQFGFQLAFDVRNSMDNLFEETHGKLYLEYRIHQKDIGEPESDWNPLKIYTFPKNTTKIVYFFNYSESHWTLLEMDLRKDQWVHTLYNSFDNGTGSDMKGPSWNAAKVNCHLLENLVQAALGIPPPAFPSKIISGLSNKQINDYDCGVLTVANAIQLLFGRKTERWSIDCNKARLEWLTLLNKKLATLESRENKVKKSATAGSRVIDKNCSENTFTDHVGNFIQNTAKDSEYSSTTSPEAYYNQAPPDRQNVLWRWKKAASKTSGKRPKNRKGDGNPVSLIQDFAEMHLQETTVPSSTASRANAETQPRNAVNEKADDGRRKT